MHGTRPHGIKSNGACWSKHVEELQRLPGKYPESGLEYLLLRHLRACLLQSLPEWLLFAGLSRENGCRVPDSGHKLGYIR